MKHPERRNSERTALDSEKARDYPLGGIQAKLNGFVVAVARIRAWIVSSNLQPSMSRRSAVMRRIRVDLPEEQIEDLERLSEERRTSLSVLVREAVTGYLAARQPIDRDAAFGLWRSEPTGDLPEDGLDYQRRLRSEW
ncbi:CopG family transcriptional regulator [Mongoliimonas terrestris]|uniref:ribbon-helix-helix domain-containing protein n=1 Tax=Mongoliimonas terrestris TaxID=1709001 RepID=UPI0009FACEFC|nr:CopG family transcriptional regulator [Mongoliimonas terrestris]